MSGGLASHCLYCATALLVLKSDCDHISYRLVPLVWSLRRPRWLLLPVRCSRRWGAPLESSKCAAAGAVAHNKRLCNQLEPNNYVMNDDYFLKSFPGPAITNDTDDDEDGDGDQDENEDEDRNDDDGNGDVDDDEDENTDENEYAFFCGRRMTNYCFICD